MPGFGELERLSEPGESSRVEPQPPPIRNERTPVWDLVISDMRERKEFGWRKYKTYLQAFNGRDALVDAYQEALDLCVYLRQSIEERTSRPPGGRRVSVLRSLLRRVFRKRGF